VLRSRIALSCLVLIAALPWARAAEPEGKLEVEITGLSSTLEQAVRSGLTLQQYRDRAVSDAQLRRLLSIGEQEIRGTLEAWGYYDGRISSRMEPRPEGGQRALFDVNPGEPILVTRSSVTVTGPGAEVPEVAVALHAFTPRVGERFDHAQYEAS